MLRECDYLQESNFRWFSSWVSILFGQGKGTNEIIINVPLALKIMTTGYIWPISAWQELISGDLVASEENVTVSPR